MLHGHADEVELVVMDDGIGFDVNAAMRGPALGLVAMQQRLNLVNGRISFESRPGAGTTVRASVPRAAEDSAAAVVTK